VLEALAQLSGRFALFIADWSRHRLLAVRDQMGIHPLFYTEAGGGLMFSASIDALLAQPEVSRDLDRVVVAEHLMHRWVDPNETYFSDVRRVPPGHVLEAAGASRVVRRYWDPGSPTVRRLTDEEAVAQFAPVFEQAVARCAGARRSAVFLSGGFDSVSIAATATTLARRAGRSEPYALSLGFPDPDCDEQARVATSGSTSRRASQRTSCGRAASANSRSSRAFFSARSGSVRRRC
jgi:asparagine synthase (glutamine-hydrolysing)